MLDYSVSTNYFASNVLVALSASSLLKHTEASRNAHPYTCMLDSKC